MPPAPDFRIDAERCIHCGRCALDCVASAIDMTPAGPALSRPDDCIGCQHCLAVCPTAALSIFGKNPDASAPRTGLPDAGEVKNLILHRRSFRHFQDRDIPPETFRDILETAWLAPTGVNMQGVHLAALATRDAMNAFRNKLYNRLEEELKNPRRDDSYIETLRYFVDDWRKNKRDSIFRSAPHMVTASLTPETVCVEVDATIALSYLDLYAQARGIGTTWCGFAKLAIDFCWDETLWREAGVPEGHRPSYVILLGLPAFEYPRAAQRGPGKVRLIGVD